MRKHAVVCPELSWMYGLLHNLAETTGFSDTSFLGDRIITLSPTSVKYVLFVTVIQTQVYNMFLQMV